MSYPFGGRTYDPRRDGKRLSKQFERVRDLTVDNGSWTLRQIADELGIPEASASARLRDLRKPDFGGFLVERKYADNGLHVYTVRTPKARVLHDPPPPSAPAAEPESLFDPSDGSRPLGAYDELDAA